jgi:hypothetical protein
MNKSAKAIVYPNEIKKPQKFFNTRQDVVGSPSMRWCLGVVRLFLKPAAVALPPISLKNYPKIVYAIVSSFFCSGANRSPRITKRLYLGRF